MVDIFLSALSDLLSPQHFAYLAGGVVLGLVVGVLPGLGGIVGLSLLMPFLYGMDQASALAMLIGLIAVVPTSDTFASVLMGIPGSTASQATVLDGFPLAKKGEGARALAAAFSASLFGGLFGALVLTVFVLFARPIILAFGTPELLALTLFGLSMVGVLSGRSLAKGVGAAALGLAVGAIGSAPATGEYRLEFDLLYLIDGVPLVVIALGIFAMPEIIDLVRGGSSIAQGSRLGRGWKTGLRDTLRNLPLATRCAGIGSVVGAIPGLGGAVVDWIAYGHVVQTSRDRSGFGKGDIRGVIAPESANNAKEGGGLIPTLLFGIPGSGSMAVFLSGLVLIGVQPGPAMAGADLDLTYTVVWSLALANVLGTGLCIAVAPGIARLTTIRYHLIAPFMVMVISFAAFQATRSLEDLVALFAVGVLGVLLRRFGWPRPAFLIGFVLAPQVERYLYQAVQFSGWGFLTRPLVLIIIVLTIVSVWAGARKRPADAARGIETENVNESAATDRIWPQLAFAFAAMAVFAFAVVEAMGLSRLGGMALIATGLIGVAACLAVIVPLLMRRATDTINYDAEAIHRQDAFAGGAWGVLGWIAGFIALTALLGYVLALVAFFAAFLRVVAKVGWLSIAALTACAIASLLTLAYAMNLVMPTGLLQSLVDLPWPFR